MEYDLQSLHGMYLPYTILVFASLVISQSIHAEGAFYGYGNSAVIQGARSQDSWKKADQHKQWKENLEEQAEKLENQNPDAAKEYRDKAKTEEDLEKTYRSQAYQDAFSSMANKNTDSLLKSNPPTGNFEMGTPAPDAKTVNASGNFPVGDQSTINQPANNVSPNIPQNELANLSNPPAGNGGPTLGDALKEAGTDLNPAPVIEQTQSISPNGPTLGEALADAGTDVGPISNQTSSPSVHPTLGEALKEVGTDVGPPSGIENFSQTPISEMKGPSDTGGTNVPISRSNQTPESPQFSPGPHYGGKFYWTSPTPGTTSLVELNTATGEFGRAGNPTGSPLGSSSGNVYSSGIPARYSNQFVFFPRLRSRFAR